MTSRLPTDSDAALSLLGRLVDDAMDPGYQEATDRGDVRALTGVTRWPSAS